MYDVRGEGGGGQEMQQIWRQTVHILVTDMGRIKKFKKSAAFICGSPLISIYHLRELVLPQRRSKTS